MPPLLPRRERQRYLPRERFCTAAQLLLTVVTAVGVALALPPPSLARATPSFAPPCDPILHHGADGDTHCLLPLPNDYYLERIDNGDDDGTDNGDTSFPPTPTGHRVRIPREALPRTRSGRLLDTTEWNRRDGWPASGFIVVSGLLADPQRDHLRMRWSHVNVTDMDGMGRGDDSEDNVAAASASASANASASAAHDMDATNDTADVYSFASHAYLDRSTESTSPTLLVDAETGELVPHWVVLDRSWTGWSWPGRDRREAVGGEDSSARASGIYSGPPTANSDMLNDDEASTTASRKWLSETLLIHPARRLKNGHRYVVALRNLRYRMRVDGDGRPALVEAPAGFRIVRDNLPTTDAALLARKQHFMSRGILQTLDPYLITNRSELTLAWDFTTASLTSTTEHLRFMRDDALERLHEDGHQYTVTSVRNDYSDLIYRRVDGTVRVPIYLNTSRASVESRLVFNRTRGASYVDSLRPVFQRFENVPFSVWIPRTSMKLRGEASLLHYGHGLFQSRAEGDNRWLHEFASENNYVIIAGDWWGLQSNDLTTIGRILLSNLDAFAVVPERSAQGVINNLALMRVARVSGMLHDERVFAVDGISVLETERVGESGALQVRNRLYYGCSLGGILGTVYMALSSDVKVATLGVPGGPLALLFPRNDAGSLILSKLLAIHYPNTADRMSILFLMHHLWELADPAGYTDALEQHGILGDAPGTIDRKTRGLGKKKLLVQIGVTDTTVNGIAAGYLIRSLGGRAFRGNAYETSFALRKGFAMRYGIQRKDTDTADPFTGFGWVEKARGVQVETAASTAHTVVTSFAMGPRVPILPFFNYPPPLWKAAPYDTHERVRLHPLAQLQIGLFFRVYLNQIRRGGGVHDGFVWVENVCEAEGCWNLDRPPKVVSAPSASKIVFQQQSSP